MALGEWMKDMDFVTAFGSSSRRGKSVLSDIMMTRYLGNDTIRGTTATTIAVDEADSVLTLEKIRTAMDLCMGVKVEPAELHPGGMRRSASIAIDPIRDREWSVSDLICNGDIKVSFRDPAHPDADTHVKLAKLNRKDPTHPNPAAGDIRRWFVVQGIKTVAVKNRTQGEALALRMHNQVVAESKARIAERKRKEDIAAEDARRTAAVQDAQLKALPLYGEF